MTQYILERCRPNANGCWIWTQGRSPDGYGKAKFKGKTWRAHRLAYELFCEPVPADKLVMHKCDVPLCVNPRHLMLGTPAENMADKVAKGRQAKGEKAGPLAVTADIARRIRAMYVPRKTSQRAIAEQFGLAEITVHRLLKNRTWKHV